MNKRNKRLTRMEKCNFCMIYFINIYSILLTMAFFFFNLVIHLCQYRAWDGQVVNTGGNNEIFSMVFLVIVFFLYYSKDVT